MYKSKKLISRAGLNKQIEVITFMSTQTRENINKNIKESVEIYYNEVVSELSNEIKEQPNNINQFQINLLLDVGWRSGKMFNATETNKKKIKKFIPQDYLESSIYAFQLIIIK